MSIGEKIKARRKQLGLTQAQVSGDKISRNMLSLIESGNASPSLDTLYYIADKLNIRIEYLVSRDISIETFERIEHEQEIWDEFHKNNFEKSLYLIDRFGQKSNSLMYLAAECAYRIAKEKTRNGSLASARRWIEKTMEYISLSTLDTKLLRAKISLISSITQNIQAPKLHFDNEEYDDLVHDVTDEEYYHYYIGDLDYQYKNPILSLHMTAKNKIKSRLYVEAIQLLCQAEEEKTQENYDAFVFFGIYTDLENCYKELLDFEKAYRYATKKMSMMEYFKS